MLNDDEKSIVKRLSERDFSVRPEAEVIYYKNVNWHARMRSERRS